MAKQKRHTPQQIPRSLNEAGASASQIARRYGVSEQPLYRWKAKYGGIGVAEVKRLKALEDENRRLKQ